MPASVNKRKYNHQKAHRAHSRTAKRTNPTVRKVTPQTTHQRKCLASNPRARMDLSKKQQKKLEKRAWIASKLDGVEDGNAMMLE